MKLRTTGLALIAIVGSIVCVQGASAAQASLDPTQKRVSYSDLNLQTPQGATILYRRIRSAAKELCGSGSVRDLARKSAAAACADRATADAVASVDSPTLTSVYVAHGGTASLAPKIASAYNK